MSRALIQPLLLRLFARVLPVLLAGGLTACAGFHLRGADSASTVSLTGEQVWVQGVDVSTGFGAVLAQSLLAHGAVLTEGLDKASIRLDVGKLEEGKTVSAYSSVRQVKEFNHFIQLTYSAKRTGTDASKPAVSDSVRAERVQIYDGTYVLGVAEEERSIQQELRVEAVRLLAVRLGALR